MRLERLRLEFRMKLAAEEMGMIGQLDHLDVSAVRRRSRDAQARGGHLFFIFAIEFVTMPVALADLGFPVNSVCQRSRLDLASPGPQAHRSPQFLNPA